MIERVENITNICHERCSPQHSAWREDLQRLAANWTKINIVRQIEIHGTL